MNITQINFDGVAVPFPADASAATVAAAAGAITASGLTMSTARVLGRTTAGTGAIQELSASDLATFLGGVANAWGTITGTLSAQTDLQSALDAKQATISFGTGVLTALGVNVGTAGAPVVLNGALGTPSSGTLTNCTFPTLNQNTSGTAANLSGTPALPDGTTATTQAVGDNTDKLATDAYVLANVAAPTASVGLSAVNGTATTFMQSDSAPPLDQSIAPTWTGEHTFNLIPNVAWNSMATGYTGAAAINTQYRVDAFTSNSTITSYTGTPVDGTKVAYKLIGCNGTATFTFPAAQRDGDATGTSTVITPTAGEHNIVFTYVNALWYYSDDISANSVANGATGATSFTAYGPVQAGATSTSALVGSATGNAGAPFLSGGAAANGAYGALNLAGGSNVVTGVLPAANGGAAATRLGSHTTPDTTAGSITWSSTLYEVFTNTTTTYTLPAASTYDGKAVIFYVTGTNAITIDPNGSEVIVRSGTVQTGGVTMTLTGAAGNYVAMICDGVRWVTLGFSGTLAAGA